MKQSFINFTILGTFLVLFVFAAPAFARNISPYDYRVENGDTDEESKKPHPEIDLAMADLKEAKQTLAKTPGEYNGHRVKAIDAIDQAIDQLYLALDYEKNKVKEN